MTKQSNSKNTEEIRLQMEEINEKMEKVEKRHTDLRLENFKYKMAFITFNAILLALMVSSSTAVKIEYGRAEFILLFFSFVMGIAQFLAFYGYNMFEYIKKKSLVDKCKTLYSFSKTHQDEETINYTKSFVKNAIATEFGNEEKLNSIPLLIKDCDKRNNIFRTFCKHYLKELLFYIPLIVGFTLIMLKVYNHFAH